LAGRISKKKDGDENIISQEIHESSEFIDPDFEMESTGDLSFCSACFEINYEGKRKYVYMLTVPEILQSENNLEESEQQQFNWRSPRLRTYSEIIKQLQMVPIPKLHKNKRLSTVEKRRRQIVESFRTLMRSVQGTSQQSTGATVGDAGNLTVRKYFQFLANIQDIDRNFLGGNIQLYIKPQKDGSTNYEGHAALAVSRRHFTEQYVILNKQYLSFKSSMESKKYNIVIKTDNIVSVQSVRSENSLVLDHFGFLQIETWSRVYYILVRSDIQVNEWLQAFVTILGSQCMHSPYRSVYFEKSSSSIVDASETMKIVGIGPSNPAISLSNNSNAVSILDREELVYYARPICWKLDRKRRIYNYRRIMFRKLYDGSGSNAPVSNGSVSNLSNLSPNAIIEHILHHAFYLVKAIQHNTVNDIDWVKFWDDISLLQVIDLSSLTESQRMAFFLNLYHVMVLHGSLLYGPPPVWNHWNAFFNHICYVVNFEVMSIAEIEYCILRSAMSKLSHFTAFAATAPPHTQYPHLALCCRDFRLHFAINCGSLSQIELVPIYYPHLLDSQLDEITRISLDYSLEIDMVKKLVIMPKLPLQDYAITTTQIPQNNGNILDCLRSLAPYLSKQKRTAVKQILADPQLYTIKHRTFNFKCRFLKRLDDISNDTNIDLSAKNVDDIEEFDTT